MIDYETLYSHMFNGVTDIIEAAEKSPSVPAEKLIFLLKNLQCDVEEEYLRQEDIVMTSSTVNTRLAEVMARCIGYN